MALTPDLETITLTGSYVDIQGLPISGSVRFTPQVIVKDTDQNQIIINSPVSAILDATGSFSVVLPVTDDSDVVPIPFAYEVEEVFSGGRTFFLTIPGGGAASQDIADFEEALDPTQASAFVSTNQFNTLNSRHTVALVNYNQIDDIDANITLAQVSATSATSSVAGANKASHEFLTMGF